MYVGIPDKILAKWLKNKDYLEVSDEGEAVTIASGYYFATKKKATVFMSSDGFCNALNAITSFVIPEKIKMKIVISTGRIEPPHKVMSDTLVKLIGILRYDSKRLSFKIITKK